MGTCAQTEATPQKAPAIEIIEQFQCAKSPLHPCEDRIAAGAGYVAVIDGATTKGELAWEGQTSGCKAAEITAAVVTSLQPNATIGDFAAAATRAIREYYIAYNRLDKMQANSVERLTACAVVFSSWRNEIWMIGDCQFRINGRNYSNAKKIDLQLARIRAEADIFLLRKGYTPHSLQRRDIGRAIIFDALRTQQYFRNAVPHCEYSYAAIDGFEIDMSQSICVNVPPSSEVVLASDGYPELLGTLAASEARLHELLRRDPLCISCNRQTKGLMAGNNSFDDRTYIRFKT